MRSTGIQPFNAVNNSSNNKYGDFSNVFNSNPSLNIQGYDPKTQFRNNNFINSNNLLHNNLSENLMNEEVREYSVIIDSKDRNYQVFPDPFNYEVTFAPLPKSKEVVNGKTVVYEQPNPVINDNLKNVKYIKLQEIILPLYNKIRFEQQLDDYDNTVETPLVDIANPLTNSMYIVLSLGDQYNDGNYLCTNDVLSDGFATVYFDSKANDTHYFGCTSNGIKIFPQDQLAKIDKFRIRFTDPYGNLIKCEHVDKRIMSNMECTCEDPTGDENTDCFKHNIFHPLNPIFQHHLHFKIGVVIPRLSKKTFS